MNKPKHRIQSNYRNAPKRKYYAEHVDGFGFVNDFVFSDKLVDHMEGKTRRNKNYKSLF